MGSIFIITSEQNETRGHGDSGKIKKLATYGGYEEKQYPAFETKEAAQMFLDKVKGFWGHEITELEILTHFD